MNILFETQAARIRRVKTLIFDYPIYKHPSKKRPRSLNAKKENFDYFMRVRSERLDFFQKRLLENFGVVASLDAEGASALSRWADRYGAGLFGPDLDDLNLFPMYSRQWVDDYRGYNVIFDLGIYIGELVICKRSSSHWELMEPDPAKPWIPRGRASTGPAVWTAPNNPEGLSPFNVAWGVLSDRHRGMSTLGSVRIRSRKGELLRWIKQFMFIARTGKDYLKLFSPAAVKEEIF